MAERLRVALVGHCVADSFLLKGVLGRVLPGAEVVRLNDERTAGAEAGNADVVLVNRVLDGDFAETSGAAFIRRLREGRTGRPVAILVSNYADAQAAAQAAGAMPGFGKADCGSAAAAARLRSAAEAAQALDPAVKPLNPGR